MLCIIIQLLQFKLTNAHHFIKITIIINTNLCMFRAFFFWPIVRERTIL